MSAFLVFMLVSYVAYQFVIILIYLKHIESTLKCYEQATITYGANTSVLFTRTANFVTEETGPFRGGYAG